MAALQLSIKHANSCWEQIDFHKKHIHFMRMIPAGIRPSLQVTCYSCRDKQKPGSLTPDTQYHIYSWFTMITEATEYLWQVEKALSRNWTAALLLCCCRKNKRYHLNNCSRFRLAKHKKWELIHHYTQQNPASCWLWSQERLIISMKQK